MNRKLASIAAVCFTLACSSGETPPGESGFAQQRPASSTGVRAAKLWILNRSGNPSLNDFFGCLLGQTTWNQLATAFAYPESLSFGKETFVSGSTCNPSGPTDQAAFQCAVNAGSFNVSPYDVVLIIRNDGGAGGQNNSSGAISVRNPVSGATVPINTGEIGNGTSYNTWDYLYVYASHEVFEAQTDGVSGDCCDGETAYGGKFNWCSACGGPTGGCGQHQSDLGIVHLTCPSGHTYPYQMVSPPGAYQYGSPEFNGTCNQVALLGGPCSRVASAYNGIYCGSSMQNGFAGGSPLTLYNCQNGSVAGTSSCAYGCYVAPSGQADGCDADPCTGVPASGNGIYCGSSTQSGFKGGNPRVLYNCQGSRTASTTVCGGNCVVAPAGTADHC